jgi:hypothetical protein
MSEYHNFQNEIYELFQYLKTTIELLAKSLGYDDTPQTATKFINYLFVQTDEFIDREHLKAIEKTLAVLYEAGDK